MMMTIILVMTSLAYELWDSYRNLSTLMYQLWRKQNPIKLTPTRLGYIYHHFLFLHKISARLPYHLSEKIFPWLALAGIPAKALHGWLFMITVCHNDQYYQSTNHIMVLFLLAVFTLWILFRVTWCLEKSMIWQISFCHLVAWLAFQAHNCCRCYVLGYYSLLVCYPTSASWLVQFSRHIYPLLRVGHFALPIIHS